MTRRPTANLGRGHELSLCKKRRARMYAGGNCDGSRTRRAGNPELALVLMALTLVRPSSGLRIIVFGLLLAAAAMVGMGLGLRGLLDTISGAS